MDGWTDGWMSGWGGGECAVLSVLTAQMDTWDAMFSFCRYCKQPVKPSSVGKWASTSFIVLLVQNRLILDREIRVTSSILPNWLKSHQSKKLILITCSNIIILTTYIEHSSGSTSVVLTRRESAEFRSNSNQNKGTSCWVNHPTHPTNTDPLVNINFNISSHTVESPTGRTAEIK